MEDQCGGTVDQGVQIEGRETQTPYSIRDWCAEIVALGLCNHRNPEDGEAAWKGSMTSPQPGRGCQDPQRRPKTTSADPIEGSYGTAGEADAPTKGL